MIILMSLCFKYLNIKTIVICNTFSFVYSTIIYFQKRIVLNNFNKYNQYLLKSNKSIKLNYLIENVPMYIDEELLKK